MSFGFSAAREEQDLDATIERLLELPAQLGASTRPQGGRRVRRVPGDRRRRPEAAQAHALGVPGAARGGAPLPRHQAPHDGPHLQRRERALLAQREEARARRHRPGRVPRLPREALHGDRRGRSSRPRSTRCSPPPAGIRTRRRSCPTSCGSRRPRARRRRGSASPRRSSASCAPSTPTSASCGTRRRRCSASCSRRWPLSPAGRYASEYRRRHGLPPASSVQRALETLDRDELIGRAKQDWRITEPFLAEWIRLNVG